MENRQIYKMDSSTKPMRQANLQSQLNIYQTLQFYLMKQSRLDAELKLKSAYNYLGKNRPSSLFPKISRFQYSQSDSKPMMKSINKKYRNQNIFKGEQQCDKLAFMPQALDEQKIMNSPQYQELKLKIEECKAKHQQQMNNLEKKYGMQLNDILKSKKQSYDIKLSLWELRNQVADLEAILKEQENQYYQLCYDLDYEEEDKCELQQENVDNIATNARNLLQNNEQASESEESGTSAQRIRQSYIDFQEAQNKIKQSNNSENRL